MSDLRSLAPMALAPTPTRAIALRPRDRQELREWVIDRAQTMLFPLTSSRPAFDERVLLDLALDGERLWLPAATRYTVPDHCGPIFVFGRRYRSAIALLLQQRSFPVRAHARLPITLPSLVSFDAGGLEPATTVDVSAICARLRTTSPVAVGGVALGFPGPRPIGFPAMLHGYILARRGNDTIIHFSTNDEGGWRDLRCWLRRLDETGVTLLPTPGSLAGAR